jgi:uncharacterized coiled-coil protein SlyX
VSVSEREGLIARIRQLRRVSAPADDQASPAGSGAGQSELRALETRIAHLEQLVQGLQDSVHRESKRINKRVTELEARVQPEAFRKALSDDARERGL